MLSTQYRIFYCFQLDTITIIGRYRNGITILNRNYRSLDWLWLLWVAWAQIDSFTHSGPGVEPASAAALSCAHRFQMGIQEENDQLTAGGWRSFDAAEAYDTDRNENCCELRHDCSIFGAVKCSTNVPADHSNAFLFPFSANICIEWNLKLDNFVPSVYLAQPEGKITIQCSHNCYSEWQSENQNRKTNLNHCYVHLISALLPNHATR